jgi:Flp pilus assembly protein TadB
MRQPPNLHCDCGLSYGPPGSAAAITEGDNMLAIIALVLVVLWLLGFFAFHITTAAIHIVLVIALVLVVLHFLRGRRSI